MTDPASTGYRPEDIEHLVADLLKLRTEIRRRAEPMRPVVTVVDECQELAATPVAAEFAAEAARLARMGRAAGMVVVTSRSRAAGRPLRPACPCPDHPGRVLLPLPGGAARGMCPTDGRSYQYGTPGVA